MAVNAYIDELNIENYLEKNNMIEQEQVVDFQVLLSSFNFWAEKIDERFNVLPKIPPPDLFALDILKKSKFENIDQFDDQFAIIDGAWRTNSTYFKDVMDSKDIAGVMLYSRYNATNENKLIMLSLQRYVKTYADSTNIIFINRYFTFEAGYDSMYPNEWIYESGHDDVVQEELWYYIADPAHNPNKKSVWTPAYYDSVLDQWMVSLITPIYDGNTFIGTTGGDVSLENIFSEIQDTNFKDQGYAFIFDSDKNIVVHPKYVDEITKKGEMEELFYFKNIKEKGLSSEIENIKDNFGFIRYIEDVK